MDAASSGLSKHNAFIEFMQQYELLLVLPGTLDEREAEQKITEVVTVVKDHGSDVVTNTLGKNRLAYPVKQIRYGYFYTIVFSAKTTDVTKLQAKLTLRRDLLRFMISHYNVSLSDAQKAAYSDKDHGAATTNGMTAAAVIEEQMADEEKKVAAPAVRKEEPKASMEDIKKKLDKIIDETDIIPGV